MLLTIEINAKSLTVDEFEAKREKFSIIYSAKFHDTLLVLFNSIKKFNAKTIHVLDIFTEQRTQTHSPVIAAFQNA